MDNTTLKALELQNLVPLQVGYRFTFSHKYALKCYFLQ